MASVREAIVQVRDDELLQKEESYGFQTSREGHGTSTDVLELNNTVVMRDHNLVIRYPFQHHREARPENQHCKS
jgi:hypothetical protein